MQAIFACSIHICVLCVEKRKERKKKERDIAPSCNLFHSDRETEKKSTAPSTMTGQKSWRDFSLVVYFMEIVVANTSRFWSACRECTNWERKMLICLLLFCSFGNVIAASASFDTAFRWIFAGLRLLAFCGKAAEEFSRNRKYF